MDDIKKAKTTIDSYLAYCKGKGWKVDNLERAFSELTRGVGLMEERERLLYKCCLFLAKLDRHPSHLYWIKNLDAETLEREADVDVEYFKTKFNEWLNL